MRRIPVATDKLMFSVAEPPRPVIDFDTKQPKLLDGAPLSQMRVLITGPDEIAIESVKVAGLVGTFNTQDTIVITGLYASPWAGANGSGVSYVAESITLAAKAKAA